MHGASGKRRAHDVRNSSTHVADTEAMKPLTVGARVRVRVKRPSIDLPNEHGTVTRLDARGVQVKLDSGRVLMVEPTMLEVVDE